ncbi:MAG: hypothetical protein JST20_11970 [Bacteroidetes bacterium]|nr:hypothetical protein [Bacteroidota bacterium]
MKSIFKILSLLLLSLLVISTAEAQKKKPAVQVEPEFVQFWKEFKSAIIKKDKQKIIEMTAFPFYSSNNLTQATNVVKNAKEFENKKFDEYSSTALSSIMGVVDIVKQMKTLVAVTDLSGFSEFHFKNDAKVVFVEKDYCTLVFSKVNEQVKLVGVSWSPSEAGD